MAENKDHFFSASITGDLAVMQANRRRLEAARTPAQRLEFINSFNRLISPRRREFKPITGDNFKL
jgi:hypothetical protein